MRFGIEIVPLGEFGDPRVVMTMAAAAEAAGWEALFVWDHLAFVWGVPAGDPIVLLSAAAAVTDRIKLGTAVTPLPRRRPQVLAQALASLDLLSQGRVIFGTGLGGVAEEFTAFGEPGDAAHRASMLDDGLLLLDRMMSGEPVDHHGPHYQAAGFSMSPLPIQRPRIPIWIGGESLPAMRRAARWDGWIINAGDDQGQMIKEPAWLTRSAAYIRQQRTAETPFDISVTGYSNATDEALVRSYADAGATWWLESIHLQRGSKDAMMARIQVGPPR